MNVIEAAKFLTVSSAITGREPTEEQALVWATVLDEVPLQDALGALRSHYRVSRFPVMPADIVEYVTQANEARDKKRSRALAIERQRVANADYRKSLASTRELRDGDVAWEGVGWTGDENPHDPLATPLASIL